MRVSIDDVRKREVSPKVILVVAGSRTYNDYSHFSRFLTDYVNLLSCTVADLVFVSGRARHGPDNMVIDYAVEYGYDWIEYPAVWRKPDGSVDMGAGYKRNIEMALVSTHALIYWDGRSKGTRHMHEVCRQREKKGLMHVMLLTVEEDPPTE